MAKELFHPDRDQIDLSTVLDALSDPLRRQLVVQLADVGEDSCAALGGPGASKTNMTYHMARLREAGVTKVRIDGARRMLSLRADDLEARFPGLLAAIIQGSQPKTD